jgi:hypothetical protein
MPEDDYTGLIAAAHHQPHAPIILIWDNSNTHTSALMHRFLDAHQDWLTVVRLPPTTPPTATRPKACGRTSNATSATSSPGASTSSRHGQTLLKRIQYRPELIDGFLAPTGLTLDPQPT